MQYLHDLYLKLAEFLMMTHCFQLFLQYVCVLLFFFYNSASFSIVGFGVPKFSLTPSTFTSQSIQEEIVETLYAVSTSYFSVLDVASHTACIFSLGSNCVPVGSSAPF